MSRCNGTKTDGERCTRDAQDETLRCHQHQRQEECGIDGCVNGKRRDTEGCWEHPIPVDAARREAAEEHARAAKIRSRAARDLCQEDYREYQDAIVRAEIWRDKTERMQEELDRLNATMSTLRNDNQAYVENAQLDASEKVRLTEAVNKYETERTVIMAEVDALKANLHRTQEELQKEASLKPGGASGDVDPDVVIRFYMDKEEELRDAEVISDELRDKLLQAEQAISQLQERLTAHVSQGENLRWEMNPEAVKRAIEDMRVRRKTMTMEEFNMESLKKFKELSIKKPLQ